MIWFTSKINLASLLIVLMQNSVPGIQCAWWSLPQVLYEDVTLAIKDLRLINRGSQGIFNIFRVLCFSNEKFCIQDKKKNESTFIKSSCYILLERRLNNTGLWTASLFSNWLNCPKDDLNLFQVKGVWRSWNHLKEIPCLL